MPSLPVILVTGFLGSGKTTFLHRLAKTHPDWRLVFLVNEFADDSIDGETLAATGTPTQSVVGGSLFCECKVGDFLRVMRETVLKMHEEQPLDAVVIETSGTANPDAIGSLLQLHGLSPILEVRRIISIVAPAKFLRLVDNLPVVQSQVCASDLVVINKTDTVDAPTLESVETKVRELNPHARVVRAEHCAISFVLPQRENHVPAEALSTCDANPFDTTTVEFGSMVELDSITTAVKALPEEILRVKGTVQTTTGWTRLERTVDHFQAAPIGRADSSRLVLLAHEDHAEHLQNAAKVLRTSTPQPAS